MGAGISAEQVKAEVAQFWNAFSAKSSNSMQSLYAPQATVFSSWNTRPEPGRLTMARREREYFQPRTSIRAFTGMMEVMLLEASSAVAVYTFQLHITNAQTVAGRATESHIQNGRATQVWMLDPDGKLKIVHEHLSVARE